MKLNESKIERLYEFTRQHYVEWYDLQTELVDHLANAIETEWQENPKIDFEDALKVEFKKFGVFGFMDVVEKRQAALGKRYNKIVWKHFKAFFTLPKIILTVTLVLSLFYVFKYFYFEEIFGLSILMACFVLFPFLYFENKKIKRRKKETGKVWLFEHIIYGYGAFSGIMMIPFHLINIFFNHKTSIPNDFVLYVISLVIVSIYLGGYIIIKIIPSKAEEYLKETYPEYTLVNTL